MRILLVSQMWPGPRDPDLGVFVAQIGRELERIGHDLDVVAIDRRGGRRTKHVRLVRDAVAAARRRRPDVVYAHYLAPAGVAAAAAAAAARAPLVLTAHGDDVINARERTTIRALTRLATRRASAVIAVSDWLRRRMLEPLPELAGRIEVIDCGVDLDRFRGRDADTARAELGWEGEPPYLLFVGAFDERKNVVPLADAFKRLGRGSLALVGDGPLRARVEGRPGVRVVGRIAHDRVADWMAASDVVCLPTDREAFGQALLEAMACERSVVATSIGGPPEFVPAEAGVLVDPRSPEALLEGLRAASRLPSPNPAARRAAEAHDVRTQAARIAAVLERAVATG